MTGGYGLVENMFRDDDGVWNVAVTFPLYCMRNQRLSRSPDIDTPIAPDNDRRPEAGRSITARTLGALTGLFSFTRAEKKSTPQRPYQFSGAERLEDRFVFSAGDSAAEVWCIEQPSTLEAECETVAEVRTIDLSTLEPGIHPETWSTTIRGLGKVTMRFEGGTKVDGHGISAVRQPVGGTGWSIDFEDRAVKLLSAELDFGGTSPRGMLRLQNNGEYIRENGRILDFPLAQSVNFGGRMTDQISEGQDSGTVALRSITAEVTVTRPVGSDIADDLADALLEEARALREALGTLRQRLMQEQIRLTELQTLLTTAHASVDQLTGEYQAAQKTTGLRTTEKNAADTSLASAQKALDSVTSELRLAIDIIDRSEASRRLVTSVEQQILDAARRIQEARKKEADAQAAFLKKPQDRILQQAYITARTQSALVFVTETRKEVQLRAALVTAKAQIAKDAPALQKALADKAALTVRVTSATVLRDAATIALDTATRVLAESTECEQRMKQSLTAAISARDHAQNDVAAQRIIVDELIAAIQQKEASLAIIEKTIGERERTKSPTEQSLNRLNDLTQAWSLQGKGNRGQLLMDRGTALKKAAEELSALEEKAGLEGLSGHAQAIALRLVSSLQEWQEEQSGFDAYPWQMLSNASQARLFTEDAPERPALSVVNLSGPNATFLFQGALEGRTVRMLDMGSPGDLGAATVRSASDGDEQTATVTINAQNPTGIYGVQLMDAQGKVLSTLQLSWNQSTKMLSLVDAGNAFVPRTNVHDDGSLSHEELFTLAKSQEDRQSTVAGIASAKEQIFSGIASAIPIGTMPDFNMNYSKIFRENAQIQLLELGVQSGFRFILTAAEVQNAFLEFNPEYRQTGSSGFQADKGYFLNEFNKKFIGYYQNIALLLQKTMDMVLASRQGKNIDTMEYWRGIHSVLDRTMYRQQLAASAMAGVTVPEVMNMLGVAQGIYDKKFDEFLAFQDATYKEMADKQKEFANWQPSVINEGSSNAHQGMAPAQSEAKLRAMVRAKNAAITRGLAGDALQMYNRGVVLAQHDHEMVLSGETVYAYGAPPESAVKRNFDIVIESEGIGTPAERAAAYLEVHPEAKQYLPGLSRTDQENIFVSYMARNPHDTSFIENLSVGVQETLRASIAKAQSPTLGEREELLIAEQKLVAMIPGYIRSEDIVEIDGHIDLGKREVIHLPNLSLTMQPKGYKVIHFELTHDMMVNLDVPGVWDRNIALTIQGTNLPAGGYTSDKAKNSGESISLRLPAGKYTCTVQDTSKYDGLEFGHVVEEKPFNALINIDAVTYNSAEIVGRISIEGDPRVMPVSLRVAKFLSNGDRDIDYTAASFPKLNPNLPVWVVVHGMDDDEKGSIERVAKVLKEYPGMQVVTIDWKKAADAFLKTGNDAPWTKGVGEWIANQLLNLGFDPANINIAGHSHGTYVGYAMANKVMDTQYGAQINAFVALDPAGNIPALSGFKVGDMKFAPVSRNSIAIEGSLGAGNNALAETSDLAFQIDSSNTHTPFSEHSLPVETFISLLSLGKKAPASVPDYLKLDNILTPYDRQNIDLRRNFFRNYYEGIIAIDTRKAFDAYGKDYLFALPKSITTRHNGDENNDVDSFPSVDSFFA